VAAVSRRGHEAAVAGLLVSVFACTVAFMAAYVADAGTQALGLTLGGAFLALAAALLAAGEWLLPHETAEEPRHDPAPPDDVARTAAALRPGGAAVTRRRLLAGTGAAAAVGLAGAAAVPLASLGPWIGDRLVDSPWRRGTGLVDAEGRPISADALAPGGFLTAFAAGADVEELGSPIVVVRLEPAQLRLPESRGAWAPEGLVAYSKVCTHAGCAVSMLRSPLFSAHVPGPALVCPCHYSTFDVTDGGTVLFGPAGRPLPQLPLSVRPDGTVAAAGPLSGDVGPAWFGTRAPGRSGGW
jgi:ubiquinol-cytochrome c reductase iron-sulfur subunit